MPLGTLEAPVTALTLGDLVSLPGLKRLADALAASPAEVAEIHSLASGYVRDNPHLATLPIGKTDGSAYYDVASNRLALEDGNPDVFSHELEHAVRLSTASDAYKALLSASKKLTRVSNFAAGPTAAAISMLVKDQALKENIMRGVALLGVASAAPNLFEESVASGRAFSKSTNKLRTLRNLAPAFGSHALHDLTAPGLLLGFANLGRS
jgi:hypothetical protein